LATGSARPVFGRDKWLTIPGVINDVVDASEFSTRSVVDRLLAVLCEGLTPVFED
jgi:hypothetical protein